MSALDGSSQLRINPDTGEIEAQPLTWDGEPVYHPESMVELFNSAQRECCACDMADEPEARDGR